MVLRRITWSYLSDFNMEMKGAKLKLIGENDYRLIFDHDALNDIDVELSRIPKEKRMGVARALLAASNTYCMAGSINYMLRARGVKTNGISATSCVRMGKDDKGRSCVEGLDIEIQVDIPNEGRDVFNRCVDILKDGCLVTRSLKKGIKVQHTIICK
jgi:organic hydroperoxide reductase OsmC/OhrA